MAGKLWIPGITGILGDQGSGKSFATIKIALQYAEQIEFDLTFNFSVNLRAMYNYCLEMGYIWLLTRLRRGMIRVRDSRDLIDFMDRPKTIYILDEAGVYLNSRKYQDIDPEFLHQLAQVRHDGKMLWWIAQYYDMSDKMLRNLSGAFIQCLSEVRFNKKLGNSELYWQKVYLYKARDYKIFLNRVNEKMTGIKFWINSRKLASFHWEGILSAQDKMLFDIYQSFGSKVGDEVKKKDELKLIELKQVNFTEDEFNSFFDRKQSVSQNSNNPYILFG
jgi:hypothetical protein